MSAPNIDKFRSQLAKEQENYDATQGQIATLQEVQKVRFKSICDMSVRIANMLANPGTSVLDPVNQADAGALKQQTQASTPVEAAAAAYSVPEQVLTAIAATEAQGDMVTEAQHGTPLTAQTFPLGLPSGRTIEVCGSGGVEPEVCGSK